MNEFWDMICATVYYMAKVAMVGVVGLILYCFVILFQYGGG